MDALAQRLNFQYEVIESPKNEYGNCGEWNNGTVSCTGMVKLLYDRVRNISSILLRFGVVLVQNAVQSRHLFPRWHKLQPVYNMFVNIAVYNKNWSRTAEMPLFSDLINFPQYFSFKHYQTFRSQEKKKALKTLVKRFKPLSIFCLHTKYVIHKYGSYSQYFVERPPNGWFRTAHITGFFYLTHIKHDTSRSIYRKQTISPNWLSFVW